MKNSECLINIYRYDLSKRRHITYRYKIYIREEEESELTNYKICIFIQKKNVPENSIY